MKKTMLFAALLLGSLAAIAQNTGLVTVPSKYPVAETTDRFEAAVKAAPGGFKIFSRVDFQDLAASQGGKVRAEQLVIFGRGGVLQALLPQVPVSAIDLPRKALAWEDERGKVWLTYNTGEYLAQRHGIQGHDDVLKRLTDVTAAFARTATE